MKNTNDQYKGFEDVKPMVFWGYPVDTEDYEDLRNSMENYN
jgi:translation elongation factor EF-4